MTNLSVNPRPPDAISIMLNNCHINNESNQPSSIRRDRRLSSSKFNITQNRELENLPLIKGNVLKFYSDLEKCL